jgi:hypothetical protein
MPITLAEPHYCSADLRPVYAMDPGRMRLGLVDCWRAEFPEPEWLGPEFNPMCAIPS